jgi:hypothetical protein
MAAVGRTDQAAVGSVSAFQRNRVGSCAARHEEGMPADLESWRTYVKTVSEEIFAQEQARLGKQVHFHDGVWWVKAAPFYYKPIHEFRPFPPGSARPDRFKALLGYSHQVPDSAQATRNLRWNILQGEDLRGFGIDCLKSAKRRAIRRGLGECKVEQYEPTERNLGSMRQINISQAQRFEGAGESGTFLPATFYNQHADKWREGIVRLFGHQGHQLIGAFVGDTLAAYVDLIRIEDTWMLGAVKSHGDYLRHRPVDALYFTILSMASQEESCNRVVNGGPDGERETLTYFKEEFFLKVTTIPYYTRMLLPLERLRALAGRVTGRRHGQSRESSNDTAKTCAASRES